MYFLQPQGTKGSLAKTLPGILCSPQVDHRAGTLPTWQPPSSHSHNSLHSTSDWTGLLSLGYWGCRVPRTLLRVSHHSAKSNTSGVKKRRCQEPCPGSCSLPRVQLATLVTATAALPHREGGLPCGLMMRALNEETLFQAPYGLRPA